MLNRKKYDFIKFMVNSGVLKFGDFVTKSGRNTPYFINTGNYKTGAQMNELGKYYAQMVCDITNGDFNAMFGPAYKGIPLVTSVATSLVRDHDMDKPFFFNRKEVKDHGEGGQIIGYKPEKGETIIIIEDVLTSGAALRETLPLLKDYNVKDMFISVDRSEKGAHSEMAARDEVFSDFGVTVHSIVNVYDVREYLIEEGIDADLLNRMDAYMKQYCK